MDWTRANEKAGVGTFLLTLIMLGAILWPYAFPAKPESQSTQAAQADKVKQGILLGGRPVIPWVPLSILAAALLFAGILHLKAASVSRRPIKATPRRSQLSLIQYSDLVGSFLNLTWAQKVAMKILCQHGLNHEISLRLELEKMGFGSEQEVMERIVKPVCASRLVDRGKEGEIALKRAWLADVEEIVNEWNYQL